MRSESGPIARCASGRCINLPHPTLHWLFPRRWPRCSSCSQAWRGASSPSPSLSPSHTPPSWPTSAPPPQVAALLLTLVGLEGRVIFYAFSQYISLQPPWSWLAVTLALFGPALVLLAHHFGLLGSALDVTAAGACGFVRTPAAVTPSASVVWPLPPLSCCS